MIQIKNIDGKVIYEGEGTLKEVLEKAVRGRAYLWKANLTEANLTGVNLTGANLIGANLYGANLWGAGLARANLIRTDLQGADLSVADLSVADLRDANLRGVKLGGADLKEANLAGADLRGADLTDTILDPKNEPNQEGSEGFERMPSGRLIGYRTRKSIHVGDNEYIPGKVYKAPYFSTCEITSCHPGLYVWPIRDVALSWAREHLCEGLVVVSFKPEDLHHVGGKYRVKEFRVLKRKV